MDLTDEQKQAVTGWIKEGLGLSDVQRRLKDEFKLSMTYMEVRFVVLDLGLDLVDKEPVQTNVDVSAPPVGTEEEVPADGGSAVSVEVDRITTPGLIVSGTVTFSDGVSAKWGLDQAGRLALDASTPDYRPAETDMQAFQQELRTVLQKRGF